MENEVAVRNEQYPLTAMAVVAQVRLIQEVMQAVMREGTHYGVIPGCAKPSLWKPGAEKLLVTFRIATESIVDDLSTQDEARYRVTRRGAAIHSGLFVGSAVGECSSSEEKYKWRFASCKAEFEATPEDRRRLKYKRDGSAIEQIRTNHADVANTILKMADKRAYVALALNTTAASDIFTQDIEDLPSEIAEGLESHGEPAKRPITPPQAKPAASGDGVVTFVPVSVEVRTGEKDGKAWTKYGIKAPDGKVYGTFDENFGNLAQDSAKDKAEVIVGFKLDKTGKYLNVVIMKPAVTPDPGSAQ